MKISWGLFDGSEAALKAEQVGFKMREESSVAPSTLFTCPLTG